MNAHDCIIEALPADDKYPCRIALVVSCSCGNLLLEIEGNDHVQTSLDLINEARFAHYDNDILHGPVCEICGEE